MSTLRQELDVPGPNPEVYALARRFAAAGWEPMSPDWATDTTLTPKVRRLHMLTEGNIEMSAIAAAILAGVGQGVDHNIVTDLVGDEDNPRSEPIDFREYSNEPIGNMQAFQALAHGMATTYGERIFARIDELSAADPEYQALIDRANTLLAMTPDGPGTFTDSKLDVFLLDNLDEATWFQAALLRVIPGLANAAMGSIPPYQRAETYRQIAHGSTQFVRDMSLIPAQISRYIGEDAICEGQIGLWSAILTDPSPEAYLAYFKLVEYDGKLGVAFSDDFTERLFAKTLELITKINPVTGKPFITADNWYGCPGIHKLGGSQLNIDMWQHHVAIAPQIYEAVDV